MPEPSPILALNCGSSSLRFSLYALAGTEPSLVVEGSAEEIGGQNSSFSVKPATKKCLPIGTHLEALSLAMQALRESSAPEPLAVGHRFVHGGPIIRTHRKLTPETARELEKAASFAPLHVPPALAVLKATEKRYPNLPQVVCLDTAFHTTIPDVADTYPLPSRVRDAGVKRYGFHGLSLESIVGQLQPAPARLIVAHLGNGSSITAIRDGASIDTSMGFTPNAGVMMGTRCGDLDSGIAIFLMRQEGLGSNELERMLNSHSGLLGVSGITSDVRQLMTARHENADADLALRMFCYQVRKTIAAMAAAMDGVNVVIFTGGIGEHAHDIRNEICVGLSFLGNVDFRVLHTDEDLQIARITARLALTAEASE